MPAKQPTDHRTGVAIGFGIAIGSAVVFFALPVLLGVSPGWRQTSFTLGAFIGFAGIAGAMFDLDKICGRPAYTDLGVALMLFGWGTTLVALRRLGVVEGLLATAITAIAALLILFACIGGAMGFAKFGEPPPAQPPSKPVGRKKKRVKASSRGLSRYELLTLLIAAVSTTANVVALFVEG